MISTYLQSEIRRIFRNNSERPQEFALGICINLCYTNGIVRKKRVIICQGFKDVVGHSEIIQYIQNAVTEDKVSHAYILNGEKGSGKKMLAGLLHRLCSVKRAEQNRAMSAIRASRQSAAIIRILSG